MSLINSKRTAVQALRQNETPRYHYLDFPDDVPIVPSIVDFKNYFSVSVAYMAKIRPKSFLCRLSPLFREDLSQGFSAYLARIGLPEIPDGDCSSDPNSAAVEKV